MPKPVTDDELAARLATLLAFIDTLPEVVTKPVGEKHLAFSVRKKTFAHYLHNHHGDGIIAISCKSTHDRRDELAAEHPDRYTIPDYTGPQGWVGLRLDRAKVYWDEVNDLLTQAYRLQAPKKLADTL